MFISLLFGMSLTFLLGLLSAILIAVAFHHLATKSSYLSILFAFIIFFCSILAPWLLPSHCCRAVLRFSLPILILATIFIGMPFSLLPFILSLFSQQLSRLFILGWTFLWLSCRFCSGPVVAILILLLKTFLL